MSLATPILHAEQLRKRFTLAGRGHSPATLTALDNVSIQLGSGETVGIAGESGCGKSTLAKILAGLLPPDSGEIYYRGTPLAQLNKAEKQRFRRTTQMIFQDPFSSLNPRMRIGDIIAEPLTIAGASAEECRAAQHRLLPLVGLPIDHANRFPDEFSGGQRQRIGIARALAAAPDIIIADEPVSSLDISIQAQIINILMQMKRDFSLSMMIVSHNLLVLRHMCDRIVIMYLGAVVESGTAAELFQRCRHPYTEALIAAVPGMQKNSRATGLLLKDDLPSAVSIPSGCRFHPRCRYATEICHREVPPFIEHSTGHSSACHHSTELFGAA